MLREMFALDETFIADFANVRTRHVRILRRGRRALDDDVVLRLRRRRRRFRLFDDLQGNSVTVLVLAPHRVRVIDEEIRGGQRRRHPHQLQSVGRRLNFGRRSGQLHDRRHLLLLLLLLLLRLLLHDDHLMLLLLLLRGREDGGRRFRPLTRLSRRRRRHDRNRRQMAQINCDLRRLIRS